MLAIPIVELRGGQAVRPGGSGEPGAGAPVGDGVSLARSFAHAGFHRIHVVDGDALAGTGSNASLVEDIIRDGALEVQVNDAAQSSDQIEQFVSAGATRVVVGPRGLEEPDWLAGAAELYPGLLIVPTDVRERRVVTRGWVRTLPLDILDVVSELNGLPLGGLLIDVGHDGARVGLDLSLIEDIAEASQFPVFASGGVSSMNDLRALEHRGVSAVLLGEPLYDGQLEPRTIALEFGE
ncbi:MAG TPA: HisA/HisF-related TIM barrel protein [Gemmatimonadaceae bacterium]